MMHQDSRRMENPPNSVVDGLRFRESLVSALVGCQKSISGCPRQWEHRKISHTNDPDANAYQSGAKAIEGPESEPGKLIDVRVGVLDTGRGNQQLNGDGGLVDDGEQEEVPDSGARLSQLVEGQ